VQREEGGEKMLLFRMKDGKIQKKARSKKQEGRRQKQ